MPAFVVNEMSAFSVLQGSLFFNQEVSGGHSLSSMVFRDHNKPQKRRLDNETIKFYCKTS